MGEPTRCLVWGEQSKRGLPCRMRRFARATSQPPYLSARMATRRVGGYPHICCRRRLKLTFNLSGLSRVKARLRSIGRVCSVSVCSHCSTLADVAHFSGTISRFLSKRDVHSRQSKTAIWSRHRRVATARAHNAKGLRKRSAGALNFNVLRGRSKNRLVVASGLACE